VSRARRSCWSWAGLAFWLANAALGSVLAAALVLGPQLTDGAWDRGAHVTPAQAAAHAALTAAGFARHHHVHSVPQTPSAGEQKSPLVQPYGSGLRWATPFSQVVQPGPAFWLAAAGCGLLIEDETQPTAPELMPPNPPPETA